MAESAVKVPISATVMVAPRALLSAFSRAFRRSESGMFTVCGGATIGSNSTVTPLLCRAGIWVLMDKALSGFPFRLTVSPFPNPVFVTREVMSDIELPSSLSCVRLVSLARGEMLDIELPLSHSAVRLVNPASGDMSDMALSRKFRTVSLVNLAMGDMSAMLFLANRITVRLVNPAKGERLDIELSRRSSTVNLVACSMPVKLVMFCLMAESVVRVAISATVMVAPRVLASAFSMAFRRLASGMFTVWGGVTIGSN